MEVARDGSHWVAYLKNELGSNPVAFIAEGETADEAGENCLALRDKRYFLGEKNA